VAFAYNESDTIEHARVNRSLQRQAREIVGVALYLVTVKAAVHYSDVDTANAMV
jgi:hypothetical protein